MSDEHDTVQSTGRALADGSWTVPGLWRPDEVRDRLGRPRPRRHGIRDGRRLGHGDLGRIPAVGDEVETDGWRVRVQTWTGLRVDRLRFFPPQTEPGPGDAGGMP